MQAIPMTASIKSSGEPKAKNQWTNDRDCKSQNQRPDQGANQRTHKRGAQSPAGLSILGHRIAVHDGGCRYRFARNAEKN